MSGEIRSSKASSTTPKTTARLNQGGKKEAPSGPQTGRLTQDRVNVSKRPTVDLPPPDGGAAHQAWEENIVLPVKEAQRFWDEKRKEGGLSGAAGFVMGGLLELSGVPSIAKNTSAALDNRKSAKERLTKGAFAAGEIALNFVPIGKIGKLGSKVLKISGGAKAIQKIRNATKLGAEVKAGTKILHYTTKEAAEKIAASGMLKGSERGFLSMAGKGEHLVVSAKNGLPAVKKQILNNGQIYAVAADGKTSKLGSVVDAIVGVGADTKLGKLLGKVSPAKTNYGAVVEHVLTAEEAARSVRWGKTIVTNVPPSMKGLVVSPDTVKVLANQAAEAAGQVVKNQKVGLGPLDKVIGPAMRNADLAGVAYVKTLLAMSRTGQE